MQDLSVIKNQILEDITNLTITDEANIEPGHKVELLLTAIEAGHLDPRDGISKAYEVTKNIENQEDKIDALNNILDKVNYYLSKENNEEIKTPDQTDETTPQP